MSRSVEFLATKIGKIRLRRRSFVVDVEYDDVHTMEIGEAEMLSKSLSVAIDEAKRIEIERLDAEKSKLVEERIRIAARLDEIDRALEPNP